MLAADNRRGEPRMAALLRWWSLGIHRLRLVLDVRLLLGLGAVPLRALVPAQSLGLVLGAGNSVGPLVGRLAL